MGLDPGLGLTIRIGMRDVQCCIRHFLYPGKALNILGIAQCERSEHEAFRRERGQLSHGPRLPVSASFVTSRRIVVMFRVVVGTPRVAFSSAVPNSCDSESFP